MVDLPVPKSAVGRAKTGFRSYEVYQRMRVRETTPLIKPRQLSSDAYLGDPFALVAILRDNYPCYRDWPGNAFWITGYDDVTSVFVDDANYESRTRRWRYGRQDWAQNFGAELAVRTAVTRFADEHGERIARDLIAHLADGSTRDLATEFCAYFPLRLLRESLGISSADEERFASAFFTAHRGVGYEPLARQAGVHALGELEQLIRAQMNGQSSEFLSAIDELGGTPADVVTTVLEGDHETLHGSLANMWSLLLTHPDQFAAVRANPRLLKYAYGESLRHSPPVISADRFARHEVERFGRLLPDGALLRCSSAAANRDPRVFERPDEFVVERKDLCPREPRGTYRADGLASGISFGTGAPSKQPAVPEDQPRSLYALTRDLALTASRVLLDTFASVRLADSFVPIRRSLRLGELYTCWSLPIEW